MVAIANFMINLLCAVVSCEAKYANPEIASVDRNSRNFRNLREVYPTVWTQNGALKGYTQTSSEGRQFYAFEGVPYGQAPIGELRFRSPQPIKPWTGVREAMKLSPLCLQLHPMHLFRIIGQEDCLFVNVYTPRLPTNQSQSAAHALPVIVTIHGGSFVFGGASEMGATYWLNHDVVLVTINYRLGPLGFLSTGDEEASGNWGLKDQALAIKWIRENVQYFGGDPFSLNLMGYSSGAVSVHQHIIYNLDSRPHFSSAASLSATSFVHWAVQPAVYARHLTDRLGQGSTSAGRNENLLASGRNGNNVRNWPKWQLFKNRHLNAQLANYTSKVKAMIATFCHFCRANFCRSSDPGLGRLAHCPVNESRVLVTCLRNTSPFRLVAEQMNLFDFVTSPPVLFIPTVEPESVVDAFITEMPDKVYERGNVAKIPWVSSVAADEGHTVLYLLKVFGQYRYIKRDFYKYAPSLLNMRYLTGIRP